MLQFYDHLWWVKLAKIKGLDPVEAPEVGRLRFFINRTEHQSNRVLTTLLLWLRGLPHPRL